MIFNFFKKGKDYKVIKIFKIADLNAANSFNFKACANLCLEFINSSTGIYPSSYSINYSNKEWKTKEGLDRAMTKRSNKDIVILITSNRDHIPLVISNEMLNSTSPAPISSIDIMIAIEVGKYRDKFVYEFLKKVYECLSFDYGYSMTITDSYDFLSERKINRGLFGSSIETKEIDIRWTFHSVGVKEGYIKKIYPVNFINKSHIEQPIIAKLLLDKIGTIQKLNENISIWELDEQELKMAENILNKSQYVITNEKNSKLFLETEDAKRFKEQIIG